MQRLRYKNFRKSGIRPSADPKVPPFGNILRPSFLADRCLNFSKDAKRIVILSNAPNVMLFYPQYQGGGLCFKQFKTKA